MQWLPQAFLNISSMHVLLPKRVYANFLKGDSQTAKIQGKSVQLSANSMRMSSLNSSLNSRYSQLFRSTCDGFIKVKTFKTSLHSTHRRRQVLQPFCGKNNVRMKNQIKSAFLPNELRNPLQQEGDSAPIKWRWSLSYFISSIFGAVKPIQSKIITLKGNGYRNCHGQKLCSVDWIVIINLFSGYNKSVPLKDLIRWSLHGIPSWRADSRDSCILIFCIMCLI